jgi:hypothetical protein
MTTSKSALLREFFTANPKASTREAVAAIPGASMSLAYASRRKIFNIKPKSKKVTRGLKAIRKVIVEQTDEVAEFKKNIMDLTVDLVKYAVVISYLEKQLGLNPSTELRYGSSV